MSMTTQCIARLYRQGVALREEAHELSQKMLAKKFQRGVKTISKVANGAPCSVPADEQRLIRDCIAERDRLKYKAAELSLPRLCHLHSVSFEVMEAELIAMGVWERAA